MKVTSKQNQSHSQAMKLVFQRALIKTVDAIKSDVQDSQTMPFDTGALQNTKTYVNTNKIKQGKASVVSEGPYARRLYFHPEYNFKTEGNSKAGGMWFEPYINGNKKMFPQIVFANYVRKEMENVIGRH